MTAPSPDSVLRGAVIATALSGLCALALLGGPIQVAAIGGAIVTVAGALRRSGPLPGERAILPVGVVPIGVALALQMLDVVQAVGSLLVLMMVRRTLARRDASDDRAVVLVAGLMLVGASGHTTHVGMLPCFLVIAIAGPLTLMLAELQVTPRHTQTRGGVRRLLGLGLGTASVAALTFVAVPRLGAGQAVGGVLPDLGNNAGLTGFDAHVELGALDRLVDDPTLLFQVRSDEVDLSNSRLYMRILAFDRFDGHQWHATGRFRSQPFLHRPDQDGVAMTIENWSGPRGLLPVPGPVVGFLTDLPGLRQDVAGSWVMDANLADAGVTYELRAAVGAEGATAEASAVVPTADVDWLQLPDDVDPLVLALARQTAGQPGVGARALALVDLLRRGFTYQRVGVGLGQDPVAAFLLDTRVGWCEHFATSFVLMARAVGVPARLVTGFVGGEASADGVAFRAHHAHAWAEVHLPGQGWTTLDPTPSGMAGVPLPPPAGSPAALDVSWLEWIDGYWQHSVVGWDRSSQGAVVKAVATTTSLVFPGKTPLVLVVVLVLGGVFRRLARWRPERRSQSGSADVVEGLTAQLHHSARHGLLERGFHIPEAYPPVDAGRWLLRSTGDDALLKLAWLHYRVRYGGHNDAEAAVEAEELARALSELGPPSPSFGASTVEAPVDEPHQTV